MTLIPTRLLAMQRLTALLESLDIKTVATDMTGKVVRGRSILGEEIDTPMLAMLESPRADFALFAGVDLEARKDRLTILIQGRAEDDPLNPGDEAYWLCAAVEERLARITATKPNNGRALYPEHFMLGNLITDLEIAPPVVRPPEDKVSQSAYFFLVLRVGMAVEIGKPYTEVP